MFGHRGGISRSLCLAKCTNNNLEIQTANIYTPLFTALKDALMMTKITVLKKYLKTEEMAS